MKTFVCVKLMIPQYCILIYPCIIDLLCMNSARHQARLYLHHVVYQMVTSQMIKETMYQTERSVYDNNHVWKWPEWS